MYFKNNDHLILRDDMRYVKMPEPNLKKLLNLHTFTCSSLTLKAIKGKLAISLFLNKNLFRLIPSLNYQ